MDEKIKLLRAKVGQHKLKLNEPLKYHTFSKFGGQALAFFTATSQRELSDILDAAWKLELPVFLLGAGTKIAFAPGQVTGLVVKNRTSGVKIGGIKGRAATWGVGIEEALVEVDSGVSLGKLNGYLESQNLLGITPVSQPESTVGGVFFDCLKLQVLSQAVKVWRKGKVLELGPGQVERGRDIILSAVLRVQARV